MPSLLWDRQASGRQTLPALLAEMKAEFHMLVDLSGNLQPSVGTQPHWAMFSTVLGHPDIYDPLRDEIVRIVNAALVANPTRPVLDSRQAGAEALSALSSWWRGEFPRRFPAFPNGSERGIFGMALWNYLAGLTDTWYFSGVEDAHGYGQSATQYWRP